MKNLKKSEFMEFLKNFIKGRVKLLFKQPGQKDILVFDDVSFKDLRYLLEGKNYRKIKKKLIYEIAAARIQELSELMILKNINFINCNKKVKVIFLKINNKFHYECFKDTYSHFFSNNNNFTINFLKDITTEEVLNNANNLIHFGWKKEAIPVSQSK